MEIGVCQQKWEFDFFLQFFSRYPSLFIIIFLKLNLQKLGQFTYSLKHQTFKKSFNMPEYKVLDLAFWHPKTRTVLGKLDCLVTLLMSIYKYIYKINASIKKL